MALDLRTIAVDTKKASEGIWVKYLGAEFKIARYNNRAAEAARAQAMAVHYEKLKDKLDSGEEFTDEDDLELHTTNAKIMAEEILLDWKGVFNGEEELPYSSEAAFKVLSDLAYFDLYQFVFNESVKTANYSAEVKQKIKKDVKRTASS
jgi:hypothetical protein